MNTPDSATASERARRVKILQEEIAVRMQELQALRSGAEAGAFPEAVARVAGVVAEVFGVSLADLAGTTRRHPVVLARQVLMDCLVRTGFSAAGAGRVLGRHHGTVLHGLRAVRNRMETDGEFCGRIDRLRQRTRQREEAAWA
jgi:chromosomal replication initiation ATPase DnaA